MMLAKALASASASAPKVYVEDVFSTWLYTGTGSTQTITNGIDLSGEGGLVWFKQRNGTQSNVWQDTARGNTKYLMSNATDAEYSVGSNYISSFNSDGFSLGSGSLSTNGNTYGTWTFRKAAKFFDVVTYTGNGSNRTIAHNLGSVPGCIIVKCTSGGGLNWQVYHRSLGGTKYLSLNTTDSETTSSTRWNNTDPTSTVFSIGTDNPVNLNGETYVAYLFAHDAGGFGDSGNDSVVKCGSYTGNSSTTGPTINLGWEPQWLLIKRASGGTGGWFLLDSMRGIATGSADASLQAESSNVENTADDRLSLTSTGFQLTTTSSFFNNSGDTYIYIAIRRGPMKTPTDATKVLYQLSRNGTGAETPVSGFGFPPDMMLTLWRSGGGSASAGSVIDKLRGNIPRLAPRDTSAEVTQSSPSSYLALKSFDQNGVTYGQDQYGAYVNFDSTYLYMNYFFRRAPGFFDVVAYTGTSSGPASFNHSLGVKPELIIFKNRSGSGNNWAVLCEYCTNGSIGASGRYLYLNTTNAQNDNSGNIFPSAPTSTTFTVSSAGIVNFGTMIAYLFASCPGVSKVGSYTGTGTTLSVDCGFTNGCRFVLIKRTDSTGDWYVWDTARGIVSGNDPYLLLNSTAAEVTNTDYIDPLSSGFQISSTAPAAINANGGSFIFLAIA